MNYEPAIIAAANRHGIDPAIALAVARQESDAQQYWQSGPRKGSLKVSKKGAIGIMQVLPGTAPGVDLTDPPKNIDAGVGYLAELFGKFGSWDRALAAYEWGEGNLRKAAGRVPGEVRQYVSAVLATAGRPGGVPAGRELAAHGPPGIGSPGIGAAALLVGAAALAWALS